MVIVDGTGIKLTCKKEISIYTIGANIPVDSIIREFIGNGCFYR